MLEKESKNTLCKINVNIYGKMYVVNFLIDDQVI